MGNKKAKRTRKPLTLEDAGERYLRIGAKKAVINTANRLYQSKATGNLTVYFRAGVASNIEFERTDN